MCTSKAKSIALPELGSDRWVERGESFQHRKKKEERLSSDARQPIDYKTHALIGVRPDGIMTVIAEWPYVPRQAEGSGTDQM